MTRMPIHRLTVLSLAAAFALAGCNRDEPAPAPAPTPAPTTTPAPAPAPVPAAATVTVTAIDIGKSVGEYGRVDVPATTFASGDTITASVVTSTSRPNANVSGQLGARWLFEDGQVVNEETRDFTFTGPGVTNFQIAKPDGWPTGRYTLEVSLDGKVVKTAEFEVR